MSVLRKLNAGLARGEAAAAALVLLSMVLVASTQAFLRNLTYFKLAWANDALESISWADTFLQKGTLWLAFLGASLATYHGRHIAIDILSRIAPVRIAHVMRGTVALAAAVTAFYLARVFWLSVLNNGSERPLEYEILADSGAIHICDAGAQSLADAELSRPGFFCAIRSLLSALDIPIENGEAAAQLIVPAMFVVIAIRFFASGLGSFGAMARGESISQVPTH